MPESEASEYVMSHCSSEIFLELIIFCVSSRYTHVMPFEVILGNTDVENDSSVSFLKTHYLEHGDLSKIPGYCTTLLQCLAQDLSEINEQRINSVLDTLSTALSTLRRNSNTAAFETAKHRIFQAESVMNILVALSPNTSVQHSKSQFTA